VFVHETELALPIISRLQDLGYTAGDGVWRRFAQSEEDDAAGGACAAVKDEIAEVLVECEKQPRFSLGSLKNCVVRNSGLNLPNPQNIVSLLPQCCDAGARHVFVGAQAHAAGLS